MKSEFTDVLAGVVSDVFMAQTFAFAVECAKEELEVPERNCLNATIRFKGPEHGRLEMMLPCGIGAELAANMLGVEVEDREAQDNATDAVKELLNVVCGQFLTARFGLEPVFFLSLPQVEEVDLSVWQALAQARDSVGFMLDEEPLLMRLSLEEKRP